MAKAKFTDYSNGEVTVRWKPGLCIHSENCIKGLPEVFDVHKKPWINIEGAESQRIIDQVGKCPSGALSIVGADAGTDENLRESKAVVVDSKPVLLELAANKTYAWCACGRSKTQPWCDGSHKVTTIKPHVFKLDASGKKALCMCKQTAGMPFCDGTHNKI